MKQVRRNVFETNSSSTHSISIIDENQFRSIKGLVDPVTNRVEARLGEFGWEVENYDFFDDKLSYLVTMAAEKNLRGHVNRCNSLEEFMECEDIVHLDREIARFCKCEGIILKDFSVKKVSYDNGKSSWMEFDGYIDHQSTEDYSSMIDFLNQHDLTVEQFLLGNVLVHTDNDNH